MNYCHRTGKICYESMKAARGHGVRIRKHRKHRGHEGLGAYFCAVCKWYHLGRKR